PHNAKQWMEENLHQLEMMVRQSPKVRAVGEIGLDYHYDYSPRDVQRKVFDDQLKLTKEINISAVVHNRESITDLLAIIERVDPPKLVLHCCTETWEDVKGLVARGYFLSFTGIATYPNAGEVRETIRHCPLEQMMVETDAPYLAPVPHRGKRNEPAFVREVAKLIAKIKGLSPEEVERITTGNAEEFFGL
ncbi:MAG: TatD family hydrolase, partial [Patescibacteria group bacterium]